MGATHEGAYCDKCWRWFAWSEFVETIEERLCEECASGISEEDHDDTWDYEDDDDFDDGPRVGHEA